MADNETLNEWRKACDKIESMTDGAVYIARDTIGAMVTRSHGESREMMGARSCVAQHI